MKKVLVALAMALALVLFIGSSGTASAEASYDGIVSEDGTICYDPMSGRPYGEPLEYGTKVMIHPVSVPKWDMGVWVLVGDSYGNSCLIERSVVMTPEEFDIASVDTLPKTGVLNPDEGPEDILFVIGLALVLLVIGGGAMLYCANDTEIKAAVERSYRRIVRRTKQILGKCLGSLKRTKASGPYRIKKSPKMPPSGAVDSHRR